MAPAYDLAPSLKDFRAEANEVWPGRDKASDGWIGDADHSARVSDHNPDDSRPVPLVRAFDIDKDGPGRLQIGQAIAEHLRVSRDPRIKYVIWNGQMFSSYATSKRKAWAWGRYDGINAHKLHVHLSVLAGETGARRGEWGLYALAAQPDNPLTPVEDDMFTDADRSVAADRHTQIANELTEQRQTGAGRHTQLANELTAQRARLGAVEGLVRELAKSGGADVAALEAAAERGAARALEDLRIVRDDA